MWSKEQAAFWTLTFAVSLAVVKLFRLKGQMS